MTKNAFYLIVLSLVLCSCGSFTKNPVPVGSPGTMAEPVPQEYRIHVGDRLALKLFYNPELNQDVVVLPDGTISLPLIHEVKVVDLTAAELRTMLQENYSKHLKQAEMAVIVNPSGGNKIYVGGEVGHPGIFETIGPTTVIEAVSMAGGFKDTARTNEIVVIRRGRDHKPFHIALDIEKAMKGIDPKQDIFLQPYDVVLAPRSNIADVDLWVAQYIRGVIGTPQEFLYYWSITK